MKNHEKTNKEHKSLVLKQKRSLMLCYSLLEILLALIGAVLFLTADNVEVHLYSPLITKTLGLGLFVFMIFCIISGIKGVFVAKPILATNKNGIFLHKLGVLIPWDCVEGFFVNEAKVKAMGILPGPRFLIINVNDPDKIIAQLPIYKKLWFKFNGNTFSIMPQTCGYKAEYLKNILQNYLNDYKGEI